MMGDKQQPVKPLPCAHRTGYCADAVAQAAADPCSLMAGIDNAFLEYKKAPVSGGW